MEAVDRFFHRDQGGDDGITGPVAGTDGIRQVVVMDGRLAQAPHDLQAKRYQASLMTRELPGLPTTSRGPGDDLWRIVRYRHETSRYRAAAAAAPAYPR
jgi:hypothetical protein